VSRSYRTQLSATAYLYDGIERTKPASDQGCIIFSGRSTALHRTAETIICKAHCGNDTFGVLGVHYFSARLAETGGYLGKQARIHQNSIKHL
jgi:hypothetical protein